MEKGKRVFVLGGAGGIGAAGVRAMVAAGWRVAVADREPVPPELGAVLTIVADATDAGQIESAVTRAAEALGGLDAAWSHAGVQVVGTVESVDLERLDLSWAINVRAHALVARSVIPHLRAAGGGAILFTASNSGVIVEPSTLAYNTTKAALVAMMRQIALDYAAERIRVNALCPGWVDTPFNAPAWSQLGGREGFLARMPELVPIGRMADAEEIGRLAAFLLSDAASYITGQAIVADGGETLRSGASR